MCTLKFLSRLLYLAILSVFSIQGYAQVIHSIYFESGSSLADVQQTEALSIWLRDYLPLKETKLELKAYCDERNSDEYNNRLSAERGENIATILYTLGYQNITLCPIGKQHCQYKSESCMQQQRRVDIVQESTTTSFDFHRLFKQKPFQRYVINPGENNIIVGSDGTEIHFQKNCFNIDRKRNNDSVEIYLREYTQASEMVLAGLTTMAGESMIESGGTIEIYAVDKGTGLQLQMTELMGIIFSGRNQNDRMQAFYPSESANPDMSYLTWEPPGQNYSFLFRETSFYENAGARENGKVMARDAIEANPQVKEVEGPAFFNERDDQNIGKAVMRASWDEDSFEMIGEKKTIYKYRVPTIRSPENATVLTSDNNNSYDVNKTVVKASQRPSPPNPLYIPSNKLGFINCDRWLKSDLPLATTPISNSVDSLFYVLLFKDIQSVMPARRDDSQSCFPNIPIGKEAVLIVLGYSNDTYLFATREIVCDGSPLEIETHLSSQQEIEKFFSDF